MSNNAQSNNFTKDEPTTKQTVVAQKLVLTLTKNSKIVRNDLGLMFQNVTKTSVLRNFDGGEKPKPTPEIVITSVDDVTKTETMKWEGGDQGSGVYIYLFVFADSLGSFSHLTTGKTIDYRVIGVGTNGADVKIELVITL
jgi:hypothetical protein